MVGDEDTSFYFKKYFNDVLLVKDNGEALATYQKTHYPVVFLNDGVEIAKKIKASNRETIIAIISENISKNSLMEALFLRLSGCIEIPFEEHQVKHLLQHINSDLELLDTHMHRLKSGYTFDTRCQVLCDENYNEVKLTKKERRLITLLLQSKHQFVGVESLEHNIWEEESLEKDCGGRFKVLLNGIRKKLPKGSIINRYGMGYKLILG